MLYADSLADRRRAFQTGLGGSGGVQGPCRHLWRKWQLGGCEGPSHNDRVSWPLFGNRVGTPCPAKFRPSTLRVAFIGQGQRSCFPCLRRSAEYVTLLGVRLLAPTNCEGKNGHSPNSRDSDCFAQSWERHRTISRCSVIFRFGFAIRPFARANWRIRLVPCQGGNAELVSVPKPWYLSEAKKQPHRGTVPGFSKQSGFGMSCPILRTPSLNRA